MSTTTCGLGEKIKKSLKNDPYIPLLNRFSCGHSLGLEVILLAN